MKQGQYQWQYYHCENDSDAWSIVHAFSINSTDLNDHPILKQKLLEICGVEHNNHLCGGIVNLVNRENNSWLIAMHKLGYRYACVWFDGCWPSNHDFTHGLLDEIDRINDEFGANNWIVAGNILEEENRFAHFERNVIIINIQKWLDEGPFNPTDVQYNQPIWGKYSKYSITHKEPIDELWNLYENEVVDDFEDSLYGLQRFSSKMATLKNGKYPGPSLMTDAEFNNKFQKQFMNPILTYALRKELYIPGLSSDFMDYITLLRPHQGSGELEKAIQGNEFNADNISPRANRVINSMFEPSSPIYFVNTEPAHPKIASQLENSGFDQYVGPAAGFKLFHYAYKYGFNTNTRFVLYDFDEMSCKFKEDTLRDWDGIDYVAWVDQWIEKHPAANKTLRNLTVERWPMVVNQFGGQSEWLATWNRIKACDWRVVHCDLINEFNNLVKHDLSPCRTFMWTSNIYSYIIPKILSGPFLLEKSFINMIEQLKELHSDCWFSGTDINDNDLMCPANAIISTTNNESNDFE
jgi:hypothetical protein